MLSFYRKESNMDTNHPICKLLLLICIIPIVYFYLTPALIKVLVAILHLIVIAIKEPELLMAFFRSI